MEVRLPVNRLRKYLFCNGINEQGYGVKLLFWFCIYYYHPIKYPHGEDYPLWANAFGEFNLKRSWIVYSKRAPCLGFFLSSLSMIAIPGYAVYYLFTHNTHLSFKDVSSSWLIILLSHHTASHVEIQERYRPLT